MVGVIASVIVDFLVSDLLLLMGLHKGADEGAQRLWR